jgi:hypothetical protein
VPLTQQSSLPTWRISSSPCLDSLESSWNLVFQTLLLSLYQPLSLKTTLQLESSQTTQVEWPHVSQLQSGVDGMRSPVCSFYTKMPLHPLLQKLVGV